MVHVWASGCRLSLGQLQMTMLLPNERCAPAQADCSHYPSKHRSNTRGYASQDWRSCQQPPGHWSTILWPCCHAADGAALYLLPKGSAKHVLQQLPERLNGAKLCAVAVILKSAQPIVQMPTFNHKRGSAQDVRATQQLPEQSQWCTRAFCCCVGDGPDNCINVNIQSQKCIA